MGLFKFLKEIIYGKNTEKLKYAIQHYPYLKHNLDEAIFSIFLSSIIKIKLVYYLNKIGKKSPRSLASVDELPLKLFRILFCSF